MRVSRGVRFAVLVGLVAATLPVTGVVDRAPVAEARPPVVEEPDGKAAKAAAKVQGRRVEVLNERTETRTIYAEPNGTMTAEVAARPIRVRTSTGWRPVDATLVRRGDGTVGPRAAVANMRFSGGGDGELVRLEKGGKWFGLSWPGRLPAPRLDGDKATYADVRPGVDLVLKAEVTGYSQYLVVRSRQAAKHVASVRLGLRDGGLTPRRTAKGGLQARDAKGAVAFRAASSEMWDAAGRRAVVDVAVDNSSLTLRPHHRMLADQRTRYPVTVDPAWHTADKHFWTSLPSGHPNSTYPNSSGAPPWAQVGYCGWDGCNGIGTGWTYFLYDTSFLGVAGRFVLGATLDTTVVHSPDCSGTGQLHEIYKAHAEVHGGTTWNNRPGGGYIGNFWAPKVNPNYGCGGWKGVGLNVTSTVNWGGTTTWLIKAADDGDKFAWRKYDSASTRLRVNFNDKPHPPTGLTTDPPIPAACTNCDGKRYFGDESVKLMANFSDPNGDAVRPLWYIYRDGALEERWGGYNTRDTVISMVGQDRKSIDWHVKGDDGYHGSDFRHGIGPFVVDRYAPNLEPKVSAPMYRDDGRWHGGVGVPDTFTFEVGDYKDPNGVADIDHYLVGWQEPPTIKVDAAGLGGRGTKHLAPDKDGPQTLFVQMVDRAGHKGPSRRHRVYVRAGNGPLAQWSLEGDTNDDAFLGDRHGTLNGNAKFGPGAIGSGLRLDGQHYGTNMVAPSAVRTDGSFTVSAWVKPDDLAAGMAALSQDGTTNSGFMLNYRADLGKWTFMMVTSDDANGSGFGPVAPDPPQAGRWTHLTGVYDRPANKLRLYVNGVKRAETSPPPGFVPWQASGAFFVGREQWRAQKVNPWRGGLDEVKVYDRVLTDAEVRAAVGQDNVQTGHWKFDELGGTTASSKVEGSEMLVLNNGASFTGDSDEDGEPDGGVVGGGLLLDGVDDHAASSGPVVRTDQSFTVAAWVNPTGRPTQADYQAAVSGEGNVNSAFTFGYRDLPTGARWDFVVPSADALSRPADAVIRSDVTAALNTPTHLAAVYDAPAGQIRLYVNGLLAGTALRPNGFNAPGPLIVGRGKWQGAIVDHWTGIVDEVRAYNRELSAAEIQGIVSRDNVSAAEWKLDGNVNGKTTTQNGTLHGVPDWSAGQSDVPDQTDLGLRLSGNSAYVSAPNAMDVRRSFSVSAWIKPERLGGWWVPLSQDGNTVSSFKVQLSDQGHWTFAMFGADAINGGSTGARANGTPAQLGVWQHVVGVYDAAAQQIRLYVNGVLAGTAAHNQVWNHSTGRFVIGADKWNGARGQFFPGSIDDVAVHTRPLFAEEIRVLAGRDLSLAHTWALDESAGSTAADSVGRRTGSVSGASRVLGRIGNAVGLDGVDDHVTVPAVDLRTDENFSVSAWVHLDRSCDRGTAFSCEAIAVSVDGSTGTTTDSKFRLGHLKDGNHPEGVWMFEMPEPNGIRRAAVTIRPSDLGTWTHLAGVYDRATSKLWLYVNGTRKGDATLQAPWHGTGALAIGRGRNPAGQSGQYLGGKVDDVRMYSGRLDDDRVENLYQSYLKHTGPATLPAATGGYWRFDESTGTTVADSSGRGLNATMSGGTGWIGGRKGWSSWFDGSTGYAETAGPVLDTTRSFSVSAWAYLTSTDTSIGNRVVVGQDGNAVSTVFLLYEVNARKWVAAVPTRDEANPTVVTVSSTEPAVVGDWTHLTMTYDANLDQLRLYVNGRLSGAQVGVVPLPATGKFSIGRGRWNNANAGFFPRGVDDVRVFTKTLSDGEVGKIYDDVVPAGHGFWRFDDETVRDWSWRNNTTTVSSPVSYTSGVSGKAVQLDGVTDSASTQWWGVPTRGSLTVSAWARLDRKDQIATVVGQDGNRMSGYLLQYRPSLDRWIFGVYGADADGAPLVYARSLEPAVVDQWVHLTGVYDHVLGQLRLYLNGELVGTRNGVTLWLAGGSFSIGRSLVDGKPVGFFPGAIDEVRTDAGMVSDTEIALRSGYPAPVPGQLGRFVNAAGQHYTGSTDQPVRPGYRFERSLGAPAAAGAPNTRMLHSCIGATGYFTSIDSACEGGSLLGLAGLVYAVRPANLSTVTIHRCQGATERFDSIPSDCDGKGTAESVLGYALAYARLARYYSPTAVDHISTAYDTPPGYRYEDAHGWLSKLAVAGTQPLMACRDGVDHFLSVDPACDTKTVLGTAGHIWTTAPAGLASRPLFRCRVNGQAYASHQPDCEGYTFDGQLGFVLTALPATTP